MVTAPMMPQLEMHLFRKEKPISAHSEQYPMTMNSATSVAARLSTPRLWRLFPVSLLLATIGFGCAKNEDGKDTHLSRANEHLTAERYDKAEQEYREVLRIAPGDPVATRQLGKIYFDQGQIPQAYTFLKRSAESWPDDLELQSKLGQAYLATGEYPLARDQALRIIGKQPGHEEALTLLAAAAIAMKDDVEAIKKRIEDLRKGDQDRPGYHLALGALALRQNDQTQAETEFKAAMELDAKSAAAHAALGNLSWARQDLKAADQAFKTAADLVPTRSPLRLRYAEFKLRTGAPEEGKSILEDINRKAPDYLPPRVILMKVACTKKHDEDCAARVQDVLKQDSVNFDALYQNGILNLAKGNAAQAIRDYEYLSNAYVKNPRVRYQLALSYLLFAKSASPVDSRNAIGNAEKTLSDAINLDPKFHEATLRLAEIKFGKGIPAATVDLLVPLLKEQPQLASAQYLLASAYLAQQQRSQALEVYRRMTELFPKDPKPSFLLGRMLGQSEATAARKAFEKSTEIEPDYLPAVEALVDLDLVDKIPEVALDRVQKLIDGNPKLAQPWAIRGKVRLAQRDFDRAESDFLKAIELNSDLEPAYLLLAQLYVATNKPEQAIEKLNAFIEKHKSATALLQLAVIQERVKNFAAASDAYEKLLTVAPRFFVALNNLAVLYSERLGKLDRAAELAAKAREVAPNEPHTADTLGWILYKKGDYGNALKLLRESAGKLPGQPEAQYHVGMAHYMLGEEELARPALQKAVDAAADFTGKDEARRRLVILAIDPDAPPASARTQLEEHLGAMPSDPAALFRLARLQEQSGADEQALRTYEKILTERSSFAPAMLRLALRYSERPNELAKAEELAIKVRQASPGDPRATHALGWILFKKGEHDKALPLLKESANKLPDLPEMQFHLGMANYMLGDEVAARAALQKAADAAMDFSGRNEARRRLALLAIDPESGTARTELDNYLRETPNDPAALLRLGRVQEQSGAVGEAIAIYEKLVNEHPHYAPVTRHLSLLYSRQPSSDASKAYQLAVKARQAYPDDPEVAKVLGILNYRRGFFPQAVEQLKDAAAERADDAEILFYLGAAYHQLKEHGGCRETLQRALNSKLPPALADQAKRTLAECTGASPG
jgi:putative PEP-CTERM system TPR-repeat lipoprotein